MTSKVDPRAEKKRLEKTENVLTTYLDVLYRFLLNKMLRVTQFESGALRFIVKVYSEV